MTAGIGHNGGPPLDDDGEAAQQAAFLDLMGKSAEDILREGQRALFATLVSAAMTGKATHQELAILRNLLKDNGLTLGIPPEKGPEAAAPVDLPEYGEVDEE